ncbi:hypothetical protein CL65_gp044 [Mycobacterium phage Patience]|uniref:Uncharacterized protein n=2 Tax=Patiencevirus patience TaxID=1982360 RepID=A0A0K1LRX8_9CAUD|nr:hypothetical protein CL65_gp044 [Mycobacterium phage Patience]AEL97952.1 hypothetical protein PATIENCE_43 [Mycobacterium phage Patience]AKU45331.1 hypothetical protein MADRUGA_41 [Mycobacterium phage Madruga]
MVLGYPGYEPEEPKKTDPEHSILEEPTVEIVQKIESKIGVPWKSILAFFGVFLGQIWARATVNDIPVIPDTLSGWSALIGGSFIGAIGVYLKGNVYTTQQVEQKAELAAKKGV